MLQAVKKARYDRLVPVIRGALRRRILPISSHIVGAVASCLKRLRFSRAIWSIVQLLTEHAAKLVNVGMCRQARLDDDVRDKTGHRPERAQVTLARKPIARSKIVMLGEQPACSIALRLLKL